LDPPNAVKLIVGLGNPGREYRETRHNVGFMVVDEIARRHNLHWRTDSDLSYAKNFGGPEFFVVKPETFMNRSGFAVSRFADYHHIERADLLVVVDEVDLPLGRMRARQRGSAGTHNGLKSVVEQLGTSEFPRLRLGIGRGDSQRDLADYVLSRFEPGDVPVLEEFITRAADAAEMFAADGIDKVMNTYNPGAADPD